MYNFTGTATYWYMHGRTPQGKWVVLGGRQFFPAVFTV